MLRAAAFTFAVAALSSACHSQTGVSDDWRYLPAVSDRGAAAELGETGVYGFAVRCLPTNNILIFEYFPGDGGPGEWTEEARNSGIDLILHYPSSDTETRIVVHGPVTHNSLTGELRLTADLSDEIAEAPQIMLYGENGPANRTFGGEAAALRRVVRECAPPRTIPRPPRVERGREKSDW